MNPLQDFIHQERKFILRRSSIFSPTELKELDVWTLLISAASRYPMALFSYDIEEKACLCEKIMSTLQQLENIN